MKDHLTLAKHYLIVTEVEGKKSYSLYPAHPRNPGWVMVLRKIYALLNVRLVSVGIVTTRVRVGHTIRYIGYQRRPKSGVVARIQGKHVILEGGKKLRKGKILEVVK